jgi:hypothetical protein
MARMLSDGRLFVGKTATENSKIRKLAVASFFISAGYG